MCYSDVFLWSVVQWILKFKYERTGLINIFITVLQYIFKS